MFVVTANSLLIKKKNFIQSNSEAHFTKFKENNFEIMCMLHIEIVISLSIIVLMQKCKSRITLTMRH